MSVFVDIYVNSSYHLLSSRFDRILTISYPTYTRLVVRKRIQSQNYYNMQTV